MFKKHASVIICTCNRSESLKDTLESLMEQKTAKHFDYEVIVVDNNSKDKTKEIVKSYTTKFDGRLKYVFEPRQGLSQARNTGIKKSKGEIIIFTDDDVVVDKNWMFSIWQCFQRYGCDEVGGRILPLYPPRTPRWVKEHKNMLNGPILFRDHGEDTMAYEETRMSPFVGANMAFKKACFDKFGLFRTDLGPGTGVYGDDTDFFRRLLKNNGKLYYCGSALVWHKVEKERTNYRYIARWFFNAGRYWAREGVHNVQKREIRCYWGMPRYLFRQILENMVSFSINILNREKALKSWRNAFLAMGKCYEYRKISHESSGCC